jgi:hypothetical protein
VLSQDSLLSETGFQPTDAMDRNERTEYFMRKVASGSTTPELVAAALAMLGVALPLEALQISERTTEAPEDPSLRDHPANDAPDPNARRHRRTEEAAIAEVIVFRALERAGNRIRSKYRDTISMGAENVAPHTLYRFTQALSNEQVDDVLMDAWSCLGSLPPISITASTMDKYVRMLIANNIPHESRTFQAFLDAES